MSGVGRRRVAKSREAELTAAGAVVFRTDGDHHWYRLPSGERVCLPMGGGHGDSSPGVACKVRRAIERSKSSERPDGWVGEEREGI